MLNSIFILSSVLPLIAASVTPSALNQSACGDLCNTWYSETNTQDICNYLSTNIYSYAACGQCQISGAGTDSAYWAQQWNDEITGLQSICSDAGISIGNVQFNDEGSTSVTDGSGPQASQPATVTTTIVPSAAVTTASTTNPSMTAPATSNTGLSTVTKTASATAVAGVPNTVTVTVIASTTGASTTSSNSASSSARPTSTTVITRTTTSSFSTSVVVVSGTSTYTTATQGATSFTTLITSTIGGGIAVPAVTTTNTESRFSSASSVALNSAVVFAALLLWSL